MDKLFLIDGSSIAYRGFFALPLLTNSSGVPTNAVYGFALMLLKLLEDEQPSHVLVAFDKSAKTFRHDAYEAYKSTRMKTPSELSGQFPIIKEMLEAFSIRYFELENYEADDIIGTLAREAEKEQLATTIVTGDKDLLQLVSTHVQAMLTRKGITEVDTYTVETVEEKYGLSPGQIIDLKGLMGDSSDNIPGIPGVGEKTALKLLKQYPSVEDVLANVAHLPGKKLQERVRDHAEQARLSKKLATIYRDVPMDMSLSDLAYNGYSKESVGQFFKKWEFKTLEERVMGDAVIETTKTEAIDAEIIELPATLAVWLEALAGPAALYVELEPGPYFNAPVIGLALSDGTNHAYVPFDVAKECEPFRAWLQDENAPKIGYDIKKAKVTLENHGIRVNGFTFDVMLASYLLNPTESDHALSEIAKQQLNYPLPHDDEVYGKGAKRKQLQGKALAEHLARKTDAMRKLRDQMEDQLAENEMKKLYYELELPLAKILAQMERNGIKVDRLRLERLGDAFNDQLEALTKDIHALAGTEFNINSPKQLSEILFDKLNLPVIKKTKTGYSTSADVLEKLKPQHEIIGKILHYRQVGKLKSTYVEGLLKMIQEKTGKIHTNFQQTITATGRLSSIDPNLQNIPIRLEEGRRIREVFVPSEPGWQIVAADYSQIELRVLAHFSGDDTLRDAFHEDMDIHTRTAMDVFGVAEDAVTPRMRNQAKAVNFGIVYGISDYGLSQNLNIPRKEAGEFIERYFASYPGVKRYMDKTIEEARARGYVSTLLHRRRYLPDINSKNYNRRSFAERTAMNTPIQGTAADIIKRAMVKVADRLRQERHESRMLLQVHDELIFETPPDEVDALKQLVVTVMENAVTLSVPLKVDVSIGDTWYEAT